MSVCPGVRQQPHQTIKLDAATTAGRLAQLPVGHRRAYFVRYGKAQCSVCRRWFVAHKDGTPVYHKTVTQP